MNLTKEVIMCAKVKSTELSYELDYKITLLEFYYNLRTALDKFERDHKCHDLHENIRSAMRPINFVNYEPKLFRMAEYLSEELIYDRENEFDCEDLVVTVSDILPELEDEIEENL